MTETEKQVNLCANALTNTHGSSYTANILEHQLACAIELLPRTKRQTFMNQLRNVVGACVTVKVTNLLSGKEVEIPWNQVGGCCDPSTERYHCM